jgi:internalin A
VEQIAQAGAAVRAAWNALPLGLPQELPQEARLILLGLAATAAAILLGLVLRARARRRWHAEASVAPAERADPAARSSSAAASLATAAPVPAARLPSPAPAPTAAHPGVAEALRRIEACRLARADVLDLGGLQLATLDEILAPLCGLTALTSLRLNGNEIGAEGARHLSGLTALTSLNLSGNSIGDEGARHLSGLTALTRLNLWNNSIGAEGARHLAGLTALTSLNLNGNRIGAEGARHLAGLTALTSLDLSGNSIGAEGARHLSGLTALTSLNLPGNSIGAEGARHLAGLTALTSLNLDDNGDLDLTSLLGLPRLRRLDIDRCNVIAAPPALWVTTSLERMIAQSCTLPGNVPPALMSQKYDDNCLPRLRAYYRALAKAGPVTSRDVKVMLLGNGRVGKTKLRKRLEKDIWDPATESTHGIHIGAATLPAAVGGTPPETPLRIWDFGGQDIYLGTHALFLRSRAIFPVLWTPQSEPSANPSHRWNGIEHENFPLEYWVRYVAQMAGTKSPLLLIQSQCESEAQRAWKSPVDEALWQPFAFKRPYIPYAARNDAGRQEFTSGLQAAVAALDAQRQGDALPASWLEVKAHIETLQATDQAIEDPKDRTHRTLTRQGFADICWSVAGIEDEASADALLRVLHDAGTVFWREGWFEDLIIVDQQWALSAIYAVLDRGTEEGRDGGVFQYLRDERRGRFTRMELDALLWGKAGHSPEQQQVFIEMMRACGICFELREAHEVGDVSVPAV